MYGVFLRVLFRHDLHLEVPLRVRALLDGSEQGLLVGLPGPADDLGAFRVGVVPVPLPGLEVELHPEALVVRVDEAEGVGAVAVHVHGRRGAAAVRHEDGDLVQRLRRLRPEVPHGHGAPQVRLRMPFLGTDEVRELVGVANEEDRGVVPHQIPVAFLGVELHREAAHVALGVRRPELTGHGGEPHQHLACGTGLEDPGPGVARDVVVDGERPVRAPALGVHHPLGNALAVLMGELFDELVVLQQDRPAFSGREGVLVVGHRRAGAGGHYGALFLGHAALLSPE